jgi:hypothetical protein
MAATPSPNYADQQLLANDPTFQNRVRQSLINACIANKGEATTVAFHRERETYCVAVLNNPDQFKAFTTMAVVANSAVIGDATVNGTVPLTSGNVATQATLVTDPHIDATLSGANFNAFFRTPAA